MKIRGLTVCVNDSERLAQTLPLWMPGLVQCQVVVDGCNEKDILAARAEDANVYVTNSFYTDGFEFNVGRALDRAWTLCGGEWVLVFDCGVKPPADWLARLEAHDPKPGNLYIATMPGFELFHSRDEALGAWARVHDGLTELHDTIFPAKIDSETGWRDGIMSRWEQPTDRVVELDLGLEFVGLKQSDPPTNKAIYDAHVAARAAKIAAKASNVIPMRGGV